MPSTEDDIEAPYRPRHRGGPNLGPEEPARLDTADRNDDIEAPYRPRHRGGPNIGPEEPARLDTADRNDDLGLGEDVPLVKDYVSLNRIQKPPGHRRRCEPLQYVYTRFGDKRPRPDDAHLRRRRHRTKSQLTSKSSSDAQTYASTLPPPPPSKADQLEMVSPVSRHKVVSGLKANWSCLNMQYQRLPIINDTRWRQQRKVDLERRLTQLEHDIQLMEMCKHLYTL